MRSRLLILFAMCGFLSLLGCVLCVLLWPHSTQPGVTVENAKRIRVGMHVQDVEVILGGSCAKTEHHKLGVVSRIWNADEIQVEVFFGGVKDHIYFDKVVNAIYHTPGM